jgi:hypothetical protein
LAPIIELSFAIAASPSLVLCYVSHMAPSVYEHSAHCRACKERVRALLAIIYGECRVNHSFSWSARPEDYASTPIGSLLQHIRTALGDLRGHREFIKSAEVPPCDYYVADPPFILEFDESQHFSRARLTTLNSYPADLQLGFPISRWQDLCREIDAKDDEPFDRDERRAWYDTLRDWVPLVHGFRPTVRIYAGEFPWCQFDASAAAALKKIQTILDDRHAN